MATKRWFQKFLKHPTHGSHIELSATGAPGTPDVFTFSPDDYLGPGGVPEIIAMITEIHFHVKDQGLFGADNFGAGGPLTNGWLLTKYTAAEDDILDGRPINRNSDFDLHGEMSYQDYGGSPVRTVHAQWHVSSGLGTPIRLATVNTLNLKVQDDMSFLLEAAVSVRGYFEDGV